MATVTVAALQPSLAGSEPGANFETIRTMVDRLVVETPVDLIVLPEAFDGTAWRIDPPDAAQGAGSGGREFVADLAAAARACVVGGSIAYRRDDGRILSTCFVADHTGRIVGDYAKRKLFATEADTRTPGETPGIFDLNGRRVGVLICADLWYPELARELCHRVEVLCVPAKTAVASAAFVPYARAVWWSLAMTRAVENVLPVVVSDWCEGTHPTCFTAGAASVSDPAGRPDVTRLQRRMERGRAGIVVGRIDLDAVAGIRQYRRAVGLLPRDQAAE